MDREFAMSMYASEKDLYKAKAEYYEGLYRKATEWISVEKIQWTGECDLCAGDGYTAEHNHMGCNCGEQQGGPSTCPVQAQCEKCLATGKITRDATIEEVMEVFPKLYILIASVSMTSKGSEVRDIIEGGWAIPWFRARDKALTINGGTLQVKEA